MQKERGRPKVRPEIDESKLGLNPLIDEDGYKLIIPVNKRVYNVDKNKFGEPDTREILVEATPFTKVYDVAGFKEMTKGLPGRAKELLLYIIMYVESGQEYVWINRKAYMEDNGIKSVNTFKTAVEELAKRRYVCPHISVKDLLWINPKHMFKGDRLAKYPNNLKIKEKK